MRATIVYVTARPDPHAEWLAAGLAAQAVPEDQLEVVFVDALSRSAQDLGWTEPTCVRRTVVTPPKPTPWQGPQRVTSRDWWAMASARNTGIVLATHGYVAFLDDRCRLGPRWLAELRRAEMESGSVVAGSYRKQEDGRVSEDHRRLLAPAGKRDCGGGWLYGCTACLPLAWLLEVNGFEEGCDGLSGEDYVLGLMLANRGHRVDFRPAFFVEQDRSSSSGHGFVRRDKGVSPHDKSHAAVARFGSRTCTEFTPDLVELRARLAAGHGFPDAPRDPVDWYDGEPIRLAMAAP